MLIISKNLIVISNIQCMHAVFEVKLLIETACDVALASIYSIKT